MLMKMCENPHVIVAQQPDVPSRWLTCHKNAYRESARSEPTNCESGLSETINRESVEHNKHIKLQSRMSPEKQSHLTNSQTISNAVRQTN